MQKKQSTSTGILLAAIVFLVILLGGIGYAVVQNNTDSDDDTATSVVDNSADETSMPSSEMPAVDQTLDLTTVAGIYTGSGSLLTSSLIFPSTEFILGADGAVQLDAQGLSLAALGNPALQVQGAYPNVTIQAQGTAQPDSDGTVIMSITQLGPVFDVEGQPLDAATSQTIAAGLAQAGIVVPSATPELPLIVPTTLSITSEGEISIINTEDSEIAITFNGSQQLQ